MDVGNGSVPAVREGAPGLTIQEFITQSDVIESVAFGAIPMPTMAVLAKNISWIMDSAFQCHSPSDSRISRIAMLILRCEDENFCQVLERTPQFRDYILAFSRNMPRFPITSQDLFVKYIEWMSATHSHNLFAVVDLGELLSGFLNSLYLESSYHAVNWFMVRFYETEVKFNIKMPLTLLKEYLSKTRNSLQALTLFFSSLEIPHFAERTAATLLRYDVLMKGIISDALQSRNWRSVELLGRLLETAGKFRLSPKWIRVGDIVGMKYGDVCSRLTGCVTWGAFEKKLGKVWVMLTRRRGVVSEGMARTVVSSVNFMFENPLNTFQHNFTVQAVQQFVELGGRVNVLIRETKLVERIIENYETRGYTDRVFWGQLRQLANMVDDYVDRREYQDWERVVVVQNRKTERIISRDYLDLYFYASNWITNSSLRRFLRSNRDVKVAIWVGAFFVVVVMFTTSFLR